MPLYGGRGDQCLAAGCHGLLICGLGHFVRESPTDMPFPALGMSVQRLERRHPAVCMSSFPHVWLWSRNQCPSSPTGGLAHPVTRSLTAHPGWVSLGGTPFRNFTPAGVESSPLKPGF